MGKHRHKWRREYSDINNAIDDWAYDTSDDYENDYHNGPICESCGKCMCMHCQHDYLESLNEMTCRYDNGLDDTPYTKKDLQK